MTKAYIIEIKGDAKQFLDIIDNWKNCKVLGEVKGLKFAISEYKNLTKKDGVKVHSFNPNNY